MDVVSENVSKLKGVIAYDGTTDQNVLVIQIKTLISASGEMMFEAGKRLCVLKETLEHGEFLKALTQIGIEPRTAQHFMNATIRLSGNSQAKSLSHFSKTKLYDIAVLDDDYLKELDKNATIGGIELDVYDRMTTRELRSVVRKLNAERMSNEASLERLLDRIQEEKQELLDENHRLRAQSSKSNWSERANQVNNEIRILHGDLMQRTGKMFELADMVKELDESDYSTAGHHMVQALKDIAYEMSEWIESFKQKTEFLFSAPKPKLENMDGDVFDIITDGAVRRD